MEKGGFLQDSFAKLVDKQGTLAVVLTLFDFFGLVNLVECSWIICCVQQLCNIMPS